MFWLCIETSKAGKIIYKNFNANLFIFKENKLQFMGFGVLFICLYLGFGATFFILKKAQEEILSFQ